MNPSYNGVGTQAPQNNLQMPRQAGSAGSVGQPIVSSGAGDVVLPGGGPEKKSRRGVVALIVLVVLVALAGGGFLLWQNGVFGGRNSETAQQTESLEAAYNSYVNYVLWGVESDGRPDLMAMEEVTEPYFASLDDEQLDVYVAKANEKYEALKRGYDASEGEDKIDIAVLQSYFEEYPTTKTINLDEIINIYTQSGESVAKAQIDATYGADSSNSMIGEFLKTEKNLAETNLALVIKASSAGCIQDEKLVWACYSENTTEDERAQLNETIVASMDSLDNMKGGAFNVLRELYAAIYGDGGEDE